MIYIDPFPKLYWMRRFARTRRFHAESFVGEQTTGHHSANVALILIETVEDPSAELLKAAILHDLEEAETGDIPAPVKWSMGSKELKLIEEEIREYYQFPEVTLTEEENQLLKAADFIDATFTCLDQRMMGNLQIDRVFRAYEEFEASSHVLTVSPCMQRIWMNILGAYDHYAIQKSPINPFIDEAERISYWRHKRQAAKAKV